MSAESRFSSSFFCFDLNSPLCWLAAEQVLHAFEGPLEWLPVSAKDLPEAERFQSFRCEQELDVFKEEIQRRAAALHLPQVRWPDPFPFDSDLALNVATYAKGIGKVVAFAQAAFRQAFAGGHSLQQEDFVLISAAACEMHPNAVLKAAHSATVAQLLKEAGQHAAEHRVRDLPAIVIDGEVMEGERMLRRAAA